MNRRLTGQYADFNLSKKTGHLVRNRLIGKLLTIGVKTKDHSFFLCVFRDFKQIPSYQRFPARKDQFQCSQITHIIQNSFDLFRGQYFDDMTVLITETTIPIASLGYFPLNENWNVLFADNESDMFFAKGIVGLIHKYHPVLAT
jgi:hypothetical protein